MFGIIPIAGGAVTFFFARKAWAARGGTAGPCKQYDVSGKCVEPTKIPSAISPNVAGLVAALAAAFVLGKVL